jgi:hypothetical protein
MATQQLEALKIIQMLGEVFPSYQLSKGAIKTYLRLLADLPPDLLEQAALDHMARSAFFPTIAELRAADFELLESAQPGLSSYDAWGQVQEAIRRVGHIEQPTWDDSLIGKVVEALGWRHLCLSDNPIADRSHFVQAYRDLAERRRQEQRRPLEVQQYLALQAGGVPELSDRTATQPLEQRD